MEQQKRENGYYWVNRWGHADEWIVARWNSFREVWAITGFTRDWVDSDFKGIGERAFRKQDIIKAYQEGYDAAFHHEQSDVEKYFKEL